MAGIHLNSRWDKALFLFSKFGKQLDDVLHFPNFISAANHCSCEKNPNVTQRKLSDDDNQFCSAIITVTHRGESGAVFTCDDFGRRPAGQR